MAGKPRSVPGLHGAAAHSGMQPASAHLGGLLGGTAVAIEIFYRRYPGDDLSAAPSHIGVGN